jgi:phage baseplate assembly protein W
VSDYGSDISTFPDLDGTFTLITGTRVVCEAVARRLSTPRGSLLGAPDYGIDLRAYVNESMDADVLAGLQRSAKLEIAKDERIASVAVAASFDFASSTLTLNISADLVTGESFSLVMTIGNLAISMLQTS